MKTILVIEDCEDLRETITAMLLDNDYDVWDVASAQAAFEVLKQEKVDLILSDIHLPFTIGPEQDEFEFSNRVGIKTIEELAWVYPEMPIVAMTSAAPIDLVQIRKALEGVPTLSKPFSSLELLAVIENTFEPIAGEVIQ